MGEASTEQERNEKKEKQSGLVSEGNTLQAAAEPSRRIISPVLNVTKLQQSNTSTFCLQSFSAQVQKHDKIARFTQ